MKRCLHMCMSFVALSAQAGSVTFAVFGHPHNHKGHRPFPMTEYEHPL